MYFKIEYSTPTASFEHLVRTEHSDTKAVLTGISSFLQTVMEEPEELDSDEIDQIRENLYSAVDEIVEEMQNNG